MDASNPRLATAATIEQISAQLNRNPRYRIHRNFHSSFLPSPRDIFVYLPEAYDADPTRRFPVFYLHDGQNLFDPLLSYVPGNTWQAHTTADTLTATGQIEPIILCGIANAGVDRMQEYTPDHNDDIRLGGGEGPFYGRLLAEELLPFINAQYRTLASAANTALGGSSLGGLISLWIGLHYPGTFGKLAVLSPSLWWNYTSILTTVEDATINPDQRIWLDIGTLEGTQHVQNTQRLYRLLQAQGLPATNLTLRIAEAAGHTEQAWANRLPEVLRYLFPPN